MAIPFADNIKYSGNKPDFTRQEYETFADLRAVKDVRMPELYIAYCLQDRNFYKYDKNATKDPVTGKFRLWTSSGSSGLEDTIVVDTPVGNLKEGDTFEAGTSVTTLLKSMLQTDLYFKAQLNLSVVTLWKKGDSIDSITLTAAVTRYDTDIKSIKYYAGSDLVAEKDSATDPNIKLGGEFSYRYNHIVNNNITFKIEVEDVNGHIEIATESVTFVNPYYYGTSNTNIISDFTELTEELIDRVTLKNIKYTANDKYLVIAYDDTYGDLVSIKDQNNFENLSAWTLNRVSIDGQWYKVYTTNTKITCSNFGYTFNWSI